MHLVCTACTYLVRILRYLLYQQKSAFQRTGHLQNGQHFIRFLVDNTWELAPELPSSVDDAGVPCNVISVDAKDSFRIYYESSWADSQVQFRLLDSEGSVVWDVRIPAPFFDTSACLKQKQDAVQICTCCTCHR